MSPYPTEHLGDFRYFASAPGASVVSRDRAGGADHRYWNRPRREKIASLRGASVAEMLAMSIVPRMSGDRRVIEARSGCPLQASAPNQSVPLATRGSRGGRFKDLELTGRSWHLVDG